MSPRKAKRAVIYCRLSPTVSETKAENLAQQEERCRIKCEASGWEVVSVITDRDTSATKGHRPGWARVVEMIHAREVDVVVSRHPDRMYRQMRELEDLCDLSEQTGVSLATTEGDYDLTTPTGRLTARILAAAARGEMEMKAARQKLGHERRASAGRPWWTARPFGFEKTGEHREDEARALRQAYTDLLNGVTLYTIAKRWNDAGILTPNAGRKRTRKDGTITVDPGTWRSSNLRNLLVNPRNAAIHTYKGQPTGSEASWEPIVSPEVYQAAVRLLSDPTRKVYENDGNKRRGLLTGIAECGKVRPDGQRCGGKMVLIRNKPDRYGERLQKYTCRECRGTSIPSDYLDAEVVARLARRREDRWREGMAGSESDDTAIDELKSEEKALSGRKAQLAEQFVAGVIDLETLTAGVAHADKRLHEVQGQLADLTIALEHGKSPITRHMDDLVDELQVLSYVKDLRASGKDDEVRAILRDEIEHLICLPRGRGQREPKPEDVHIDWRERH